MFDLTKQEYERIIDEAMLSDELAKILELKIKGYTTVQISFELHMSTSTIDRKIKQIKNKIKRVL